MSIGLLKLHLQIPGCASLKEKRHRLKPLLIRIHREFNVSTAEYGNQDSWQEAMIAIATVSNDPKQIQRTLQNVAGWVENHWPDIYVMDNNLEII